jgi:disulfide bond formation protein DsbB
MNTRTIYLLGLLATGTILSTSLFLQIFDGFIPCPLCTLQRLTFGVLGILFLVGCIFYNKKLVKPIISITGLIFSIAGIFFSGRQVWLQHFPPADASECGVSINYLLQVLPIHQVFQKILSGSAECTQRGWEFLHFSMAEWGLFWFVIFFFLCGYLLVTKR